MEAALDSPRPVLHPGAAAFTAQARGIERRIGLLFAVTGIALVAAMGVLGLIMRLTQATVIGLSPAWFYRLLTLHGVGMITGSPARHDGRALVRAARDRAAAARPDARRATRSIIAGVIAVLVATLIGGFGAGWTFLPPLPFYPAGQWSVWSESVFFAGSFLSAPGSASICIDVLEQTTNDLRRPRAHARLAVPARPRPGGAAAAGDRRHRRRDRRADLLRRRQRRSCVGLLGRTYDHAVGIDALVAKNLVYFFGHSIANLTIYLAAAAIYVLVPRYAGRPYETTKVFVAGWTRLTRLHRHRLLAPPLHGLRPADVGGHHLRSRLLRRPDPGRGHHDLLDDDARSGAPATSGRSPRRCSTSASPAGRSAASAR